MENGTSPPLQDSSTATRALNVKDEVPAATTPSDAPIGPAPGPAAPSKDSAGVFNDELVPSPSEGISAPPSPYTNERLQIRSMTMPPTPNFDIPASPSGSPNAASTAKFTRFLELKKQGVHFNERLLHSSALRNPALLHKLMDFAGISDEEQYTSSLPSELAVTTNFPVWAYADELVKAHEKITKRREQDSKGKREKLDFVSATAQNSVASPARKKSRFDR